MEGLYKKQLILASPPIAVWIGKFKMNGKGETINLDKSNYSSQDGSWTVPLMIVWQQPSPIVISKYRNNVLPNKPNMLQCFNFQVE